MVLSLGLVVLMYYTFSVEGPITIVSEQPSYEDALEQIVLDFDRDFALSTDSTIQRNITQDSIDALLALSVPERHRLKHLEISAGLVAIRQALDTNGELSSALTQYQDATRRLP